MGRCIFSLVCLLGLSIDSHATSGITYHGRLLKPDGQPVLESNVQFRLQIRTPDAEDCLMYEEIQTLDLSTTNGMFSISLNDGSGVRQDSNSWGLFEALSNRKDFAFAPGDCSGTNNYSPSATDNRKFRVLFNDGTFAGWEALPIQIINYIPMSIESYAVGGFPASSLLRVETAGTLGVVTPLTSTQYSEILALVGGTSSQYEKDGELNGSAIPTLTAGQTVISDGSGGWVASTPLTSESDPTVEAFAKSSLPTCGAGEVLKSDGTSLSCVTDSSGTLPDVGTAGTYTKVTTDAKGRITSGSQLTGDDITSGEIDGTTSINTSGTITTSGAISSGSVSTRQVDLYDSDNSNFIRFLAPAAGTLTTDYTLRFPADDGTNGQVLSTDGSGVLSWISQSGAPVGSTLSAGEVWVGDGSNQAQERFFGVEDLKTTLGAQQIPTTCTSSQTMTWSAITDVFSCTNISITASQISDLSTELDDYVQTGLASANILVGNSSNVATARSMSGDATLSNTGVLTLKNTGTAGTYGSGTEIPVITTDAQGRVTSVTESTISIPEDAADITNAPAGGISATDAQAAINELDSEKVAKAGDTMTGQLVMGPKGTGAGDGGSIALMELAASGVDSVTLRAPDSFAAYTLTLPSDDGDSGQVLTTNGSGGLTWETVAGGTGTVTSVSGTAPISVATGTTTPVISLSDSGVTADTYGSATEVPVFTVDAKGRVTGVTETAISSSPVGSSLNTGQVWVGDGSNQAQARFFGAGDLRNSLGNAQIPNACTSSQTMTWSAITDVFSCTNISIAHTQVSGLGTAATKDVGTSAGNVVMLDGSARLPAVDGSQLTNLPTATLPDDIVADTVTLANGIKIGTVSTACDGTTEGTIRYNSTSKKMEFCNGAAWGSISAGTIANITLGSPSSNLVQSGPVDFVVTYGSGADSATISLDSSDITIGGTATTGCAVTGVTGTGLSRTVTIDNCTGTGTVNISVASGTADSTTGDPAGSAGPSTSYNVDNTGPNAPTGVTLGSVPSSHTSSPTISYTAPSDVGGSTVGSYQVRILKTADSSVVYNWTTHTSGNAVSGLSLESETEYAVYVRAIDAFGNVGASSGAETWTTVGCTTGSQVLAYTGSDQPFVVPAGCTSLSVKLWGAGGGGRARNGGAGGYIAGNLAVTGGETLTIIVGQGGDNISNGQPTYGGGGASPSGASGGGRSAIRRGSTELATAGGGGGGTEDDYGGAAGGLIGGATGYGRGGDGGTQSAGGAANSGGSPGGAFFGGLAYQAAGGGGSGYFGGGGGGVGPSVGGGGGGSSYTGGLTSPTNTAGGSNGIPPNNSDSDYVSGVGQGGNNGDGGNGLVVISWAP